MEDLYCSECNAKLKESDLTSGYCPSCGAPLEGILLEEEGGAAWMFQEAGLPIWG